MDRTAFGISSWIPVFPRYRERAAYTAVPREGEGFPPSGEAGPSPGGAFWWGVPSASGEWDMAVQGLRKRDLGKQVRWPAYTMAVLFLGYALGKAVRAAQGRLGFPGGPAPSASEHEWYAANVMDVATAQWWAVATGLAAAALVLATVTTLGRRIPRPLMLVLLAVALLGVGSGAVMIAAGGFFGIGADWQWHHGLAGIAVTALLAATAWSYAKATAPVRDQGRSGQGTELS